VSRGRKPIAFLFPAFPVLHQTFVMWEVLALRQRGLRIALYSIKHPGSGTQQPEAVALAREVHYLPSIASARVWRANVHALRHNPRRYLSAYMQLIREWWRDRSIANLWRDSSAPVNQGERVGVLLWARCTAIFNRNQFLYLLKSLWLVPSAVYLGTELEAAGIGRVHAHWASYPATLALIVRWVFGIPFSFTAHAYDIYLMPRLLPVKIRTAEFVVTCAQVNARSLEAVAGPIARERVIVNYHGVDLRQFGPRHVPHDADLRCIVSCGSLAFYKGHHILLRACALLRQPFRCIVIGEGPFRPYLEELAHSLGISEHVTLTGAVPQAKVAELYAGADLFVLASVIIARFGKRDVIPNVLAEAMAMQIPVVATNISGISELITDGVSGRLVPPNEPATLAAVIDELLNDEAQRRRLALGGYQKVVTDFNRRTNIPALAALFDEPEVGAARDNVSTDEYAVSSSNGSDGAGPRRDAYDAASQPCRR
jgi:glycosyltransferase involved in cell wall biosynthesis